MEIIYIFFEYLKKQKFKKIQILMQIFVATISVILFMGVVLNINNKLMDIKNLTSMSNIKGNFYLNAKYDENNESDKDINELITNMKTYNEDFEFCQFSNQSSMGDSTQLYVDENLIKNIDFPLYKGRNLNSKDFNIDYNSEVIPILVSKKLENKYPIDCVFNDTKTSFTNENNYLSGGATFRVVGILDDKSNFWINDDILVDKLNYFDVIIYPTNFKVLGYNPPNYFINIKSNENKYINFKNSIELKYNSIKLVDSSLQKAFVNKLNDKIIELIFIGIFTIVLLILSLFGFISIIQSSILLRSKEIGIHYSLGASLKNICGFILAEILLISLFSIFTCYIFTTKLKDYFMINYEVLLDNNTFVISTVVILCYIFIVILVAAMTILKKDPIKLLRD